eukprot:447434-Rhodomonas_salina.1
MASVSDFFSFPFDFLFGLSSFKASPAESCSPPPSRTIKSSSSPAFLRFDDFLCANFPPRSRSSPPPSDLGRAGVSTQSVRSNESLAPAERSVTEKSCAPSSTVGILIDEGRTKPTLAWARNERASRKWQLGLRIIVAVVGWKCVLSNRQLNARLHEERRHPSTDSDGYKRRKHAVWCFPGLICPPACSSAMGWVSSFNLIERAQACSGLLLRNNGTMLYPIPPYP